jgi:hypothetical protein
MSITKNMLEYVNDLYEHVQLQPHFNYDDEEKTKIYSDKSEGIYEITDLIEFMYEGMYFYFSKDFRKVKKIDDEYFFVDQYIISIQFIFPKSSTYLMNIQPGLKLEYDDIHTLIVDKALDVAIQLIQILRINEIDAIVKNLEQDNKDLNKKMNICLDYMTKKIDK